jgi:hypothetical protein
MESNPEYIKHEGITKCKCHKGFIGMRRSEVRFNFSCNLIGNHPQSLTALTLERYQQGEEKTAILKMTEKMV